MREALIILPKQTPSGKPTTPLRDATVAKLIDRFGGATVRNAEGAWKAPDGQVIIEPVWEVVAAYDPTPANDNALTGIAETFGKNADQQAVYVRLASGDVRIIDTSLEAQLEALA